ncbi:hydantoinase B/oxoprolinase family protein [Halocola ammonii]
MSHWKIWIDTGGTFTDCIAKNPQGETVRRKVLSSGKLRGKIQSTENSNVLVSEKWKIDKDIFKGYQFSIPDLDFKSVVIKFDSDQNHFDLQDPIPENSANKDFEITAGEEAPILAVRLITSTPLGSDFPEIEMRLGTTKGTNALLEKNGDEPLLIVTKGFSDLLKIGTQQRKDLFNLNVKKPSPLATHVVELNERVSSKGEIIQEVDERKLLEVAEKCSSKGINNVSVCLLNSFKDISHEQKVAEALKNAGVEYVTQSAKLLPEINYLDRTETAVVNSYLLPIVDNYLNGIEKHVSTLNVMKSSGGLAGRHDFEPKDSLLSGPAGGVVAGSVIARQTGEDKVITFDMGGTSSDVARYYERYDYTYNTTIGDAHISGPALHIHTVAAGGGSVCDFDGKKFTVGPESGGAQPGPASYGAGGPLCITDVNLLLGKMATDKMSIPLNREAAQSALEKILERGETSGSKEQVLQGFLDIANEKMADAIRKISVGKGYDPAEYALLAFGGAGGMHACKVAELLNMKKLIIPQDAGILSAFGIGNALEERFVSKQLLTSLENASEIDKAIENASDEALQELKEVGYSEEEIHVRHVFCYLRFEGQEHNIEIDRNETDNLEAAFEETYRSLYGHYITDRKIELDTIKVVASTREEKIEVAPVPSEKIPAKPIKKQQAWTGNEMEEVGVFDIDQMQPGSFFRGPAILVFPTSTTFIEKNWSASFDENLTLRVKRKQTEKTKALDQPEEVQLELFSNRFTRIAEEMGALLQRTAFSVNVKERLDFSCALLDTNGDLVVNAPHIPVHLGALGVCVKAVRGELDLQEGDVAITNHPGFGGSHLPDVTLVMPIFHKGNLIGYAANRAHHAEIGGITPGSMPARATRLAQEGVVIAPTYIMKNGEVKWQEIEERLTSGKYPTRALQENLADLNAALASLNSGKTQLVELVEKEGREKVMHYMHSLKKYASDSLWRALKSFGQKNWQAVEKLDDGSQLAVKIEMGEKLVFDFEGTSPTHPKNLNANRAITTSVLLYVMRLIAGENIPLNEGMLDKVEIRLPEDCMLNPTFSEDPEECPAVVGGNVEISQRLTDTLLKAFELAACSQGTMNNVLFGNDRFGYYETICGGTGAGPNFDGADGVHQHMTNTRITDAEIMEYRYPVRVRDFSILKGSGGAGNHRGGNGVKRELEFLEDVTLTVLTQHRTTAPYGMNGGAPGRSGSQMVRRKNGNIEPMEFIDTSELKAGDRFIIETPGGGGFGRKS